MWAKDAARMSIESDIVNNKSKKIRKIFNRFSLRKIEKEIDKKIKTEAQIGNTECSFTTYDLLSHAGFYFTNFTDSETNYIYKNLNSIIKNWLINCGFHIKEIPLYLYGSKFFVIWKHIK